MRERTLALQGEDVEKLVEVLAHHEAEQAISGNQDMRDWCHNMMVRIEDAE